ncbi:unnamed protein product [Polarella glacialis]|uniref:Uncharacterized protein n=1 Tax=Polarella glacialis TaxID=89957 RepID=A0A813E413_POLGL|nr:unnamed protein product [Polarella glacialis]
MRPRPSELPCRHLFLHAPGFMCVSSFFPSSFSSSCIGLFVFVCFSLACVLRSLFLYFVFLFRSFVFLFVWLFVCFLVCLFVCMSDGTGACRVPQTGQENHFVVVVSGA